ncbi:MAG: hypothetical protein NT150_07260 [Bacteroidetes bacterium]|nr:hypothetical protein [Bacteroidota bacterium]
MQNKKLLLTSALIVALGVTPKAQMMGQTTKFSLNGLGRSYITNNNLSGNIMDGDTKTHNKGIGGYNLFDLQNNLGVDSAFQAMAQYRVRSEFGAFYGSNNSFKFRQFKIMGKIKDFKYEIGDIRVELTPFTVYNFCDTYHKYEAEIFQTRRSITEYENMNMGNSWLLQGAHLQHHHDFEKWGIGAYGFVTRTSSTNEMSVSDRLLSGGRVSANFGESIKLGATYVGLNDVDIQSAQYSYKNNVGTGDIEYIMNSDSYVAKVRFEGGASSFAYKKVVPSPLNDSAKSFQDYFLDLKASFVLKGRGLKFTLGLTDVGQYYNSPTAQTRRVSDNQNPALFGMVNNASVLRSPLLFDRLTSEQLYNSKIAYTLTPFLNQFNNAQPYGKATPNRSGMSIAVASDTSMKNVNFEVGFDYLKEIVGEGTAELRNFVVLKGGAKIEIGKFIGLTRKLDFSVGGRMEKTARDGAGSIALTSTVADAGISFEVIKKVDLLFGYKMLTANGNEFRSVRDAYNSVASINGVSINSTEGIVSAGVQVRFSPMQSFTVHYNNVGYTNTLVTAGSYNISQLLLSYTGKF